MNTNELFSLQGRIALVTGGSRGIGRMIAKGLLCQGAKVYITARKAAACDATLKACCAKVRRSTSRRVKQQLATPQRRNFPLLAHASPCPWMSRTKKVFKNWSST